MDVPFESFLSKTKTKRGLLFHATVTLSVLVHAGALAWATVTSFTEVQELPAPSVKLSFLQAPKLAAAVKPPVAKLAEASGGQDMAARRPRESVRSSRARPEPPAVTKVAAPMPPTLVPPPSEAPTTATKLDVEPVTPLAAPAGGGSGGQNPAITNGVGSAGTGNGSGNALAASGGGGLPRMLPEALGKLQRLSGGTPSFPAQLARRGARFLIMAKVCVGSQGEVNSLTLIKRADPLLDQSVTETVRQWRYRPLMAGATAVPFCTFVKFEFRADE